MADIAIIIPGAGQGERFGGEENKIFAKLDGRPVFIRSLERFVNRDDVCQTILVAAGKDLEQLKEKFGPNLGFMGVQLVEGGEQRRDSVAAGLQALNDDAKYVAVHDAVRPCVTEQMIDEVFAAAIKTGAAILASPLHGTLKRVGEDSVIEKTVPRARVFEAQTPQVFRRDIIEEAYANVPAEQAGEVTDDAQLAEIAGHPVTVVASDASNLKITTKADITLANAIIKSRPARKPTRGLGAFEEAQW